MLYTLFLAFLASVFYIGAALFLKHWFSLPLWLAFLGALTCFLLASMAEVTVLQRARFTEVVVLIISLEVVFALMLSRYLLGESYGLRDMAALALLGAGVALLLYQPDTQPPEEGNRTAAKTTRLS